MRIVGYIAALTMVALAMGNVAMFIEVRSLVLVVSFTVWGFLASAGGSTGTALKITFSAKASDEKVLRTGLRAIRASRYAAVAGGFAAAITGIMVMVKEIDDPTSMGTGMVVCLLGPLWTVMVAYVLLLPLQANIEFRLYTSNTATGGAVETPVELLVLGGSLLMCLISFALTVVGLNQQA